MFSLIRVFGRSFFTRKINCLVNFLKRKINCLVNFLKMADSIADSVKVYKKFNYVPPTPPSSLIDSTTFTLDFANRKFVHIGLDPMHDFKVAVQIITASRHVSISPDFLSRIYSLMGNILSAILDTPNKTRGLIFLKDDTLLLTKMVYRGENQLVIESQTDSGCRVLLNRKDLLALQDLEISGLFMEYLDKERSSGRMPMIFDEIKQVIARSNVQSTTEPNFISQLKLLAVQQIADRWYGHDEVDSSKLFDLSPPKPLSTPPQALLDDSQTIEVPWASATTTARDFFQQFSIIILD